MRTHLASRSSSRGASSVGWRRRSRGPSRGRQTWCCSSRSPGARWCCAASRGAIDVESLPRPGLDDLATRDRARAPRGSSHSRRRTTPPSVISTRRGGTSDKPFPSFTYVPGELPRAVPYAWCVCLLPFRLVRLSEVSGRFQLFSLLCIRLVHTFGRLQKCAFSDRRWCADASGTAGTARDARFGVPGNARRPRRCRATLTIHRGGASGVEGVEHGRRGDAMRRARSSQSQYSRCSEDRRRGR